MDGLGEPSPFNVVCAAHEDGFSPFPTRQNEHSVTQLLLNPIVSGLIRNKATATRVWGLAGGPEGVKTMGPILDTLERDYAEAVSVGFRVSWPMDDNVTYQGKQFKVTKGNYELILSVLNIDF